MFESRAISIPVLEGAVSRGGRRLDHAQIFKMTL